MHADESGAELIARLVALVPAMIGRLAVGEPIYAVVMAYDGEEPGVPILGVGLASERAAWQQAYGEDARWYLWNPAEYQHFDVDALAVSAGFEGAGREVLNQVAKLLNRIDWSDYAVMTDDFVVFATDLEGGDVVENFEMSLTPEQLEAVLRLGLPVG